MANKIKVMVVYGGRSGEHEISLISAASVIRNLDRNRFEVIPVSIDKEGRWRFNDLKLIEKESQPGKALPVFRNAPEVLMPAHSEGRPELVPVTPGALPAASAKVDVVFPVMHGPLCEDGAIQGLLELANVPYVGAGVLGSAIGMDKDVAKRLAAAAGVPIVPYLCLKSTAWKRDLNEWNGRIERELGFPVFVKPANLGSSLGVHKVKSSSELTAALEDAFRYDEKVLVERAVQAREIEFSALEDPQAPEGVLISTAGEIVPEHEFYSYEAKYLDENGAKLLIPAKLTETQMKEAQSIARRTFLALECEGMARVDLFLDKNSGEFYFNEVNTIPGFTSISMYPKLFEASGISYGDLLGRLIDLAIARHRRKSRLLRERE